jgi:putative ABC transport system permease protein
MEHPGPRTIRAGVRRLFRLPLRTADRARADADEELQSFLDARVESLVARGMRPADARAEALRRLGGDTLDEVRARLHRSAERREGRRRAAERVESVRHDVALALRRLRTHPGFACTAVLTLALGIGATTAVFTLVHQVMLRPLPVARPEQLWRVGSAVTCCHYHGYAQNDWSFFPWEAYERFRAHTPGFSQLAAFQVGAAQLGVRRAGSAAPAETRNGQYVSGNFFATFGIAPWRGRLLTDADDAVGAPPVAVMSFRTWREKYGADLSVVGATYRLNGRSFTIVGVAPPGFFGVKVAVTGMPDLWLPLATEPLIGGATARRTDPRVAWLDLIGRVRPGTDPKSLETQLRLELRQWLASHTADMTPRERAVAEQQTLHLTPGGAGVSLVRATYEDDLRLLLAAALCVLLVACANVANLLLARGLRDRPRTALRAALGASRARLVGRALTESLTLSVLGAAAGIGVAYLGARLILRLAFPRTDVWVPVSAAPSVPVLLFALGASVLTAIVFGVAPAWITSRAAPIEALRGAGGASRPAAGQRHWAQKGLVIAQAALSVVLVSAAVMLGQSLRNRERQDFGFDPRGRYLVSINTLLAGYAPERLTPLFREVQDRLRAIPGVRMASPALYAPMSGLYWDREIRVAGRDEPGPQDDVRTGWTRVTPGFFETLGNRIVAGRPITDEDDATTRPVAVVNQAFARRFFGGENPVGQHFGPAPRKNAGTYEIVGVAADIAGGDAPGRPMYFVPGAQITHFAETDLESREVWSHYFYNIVIWAPGEPPGLEARVGRALAEVDPDLVTYGVRSYAEVIHGQFAQEGMIAGLASLFGGVALALAAVGLYGVTAYGVSQRTGEIGVRVALGASRGTVLAMVLRGAFGQVGVGLALGLPAAVGAGRLIGSELFGVRPWDPRVLTGAALLLAVAALIAAVIPARRAAGVDPMRALRSE